MYEQTRKKKLRIRYRLSVVFFGVILIFGLMFYKYMKSVTLEDVLSQDREITFFNNVNSGDAADDTPDDAPAAPESGDITNPVPECDPLGAEYFNDCVFIGDFITFGMASYEIVPSSNVLSSIAMSVSKIETEKIDTAYGSVTVIEALDEIKPKNIYVMLGSNGADYMTVADIYQDYQAFLNKVRIACPDSKLYILSTPPVTVGKENSLESPIKNSDIDELNSKLLDYAKNNAVRYVDVSSALKNESGCLPDELAENDGLHFKFSAYTVLSDYILSHVS